MGKKQIFGIFNVQNELVKNIPKVILNKVFLPDSKNCLLKDGKIVRRKMREPDLLDEEVKVQTPDGNAIIHYHQFTKRSTGIQYILAFTKAHIYHWNPETCAFDLKFTCSADCENWETKSYNDKVMATNNVDPVLVWDTTGYFVPLQNTSEKSITAITAANPAQVTITGHGYTTGDRVWITDIADTADYWISPTSDNTPDGWDDPTNAYDDDEDTYASVEVNPYSTSTNLELTHAAINCSKIRFKATVSYLYLQIDVYFDDEWHFLYSSSFVPSGWKEVSLGGTHSVTKMRMRFVNIGASARTGCIYEVDFYQTPSDEMSELNDNHYLITYVNADNFTLDDVNLTGYNIYTSDGKCEKWEGIEYSRVYSNETNVDETSAADQKVLKVVSTDGYVAGDKVMINRGGVREEEGVIDSIQAGVSLTLKEDLTYEHTANSSTDVDEDSADDQKVLSVSSTTGFSEDEVVTINKDGDREEIRRIDSIQAGVSLTMTVDLTYTHTQAQGDEVLGSGGQNDEVEEYVSYYLTKCKYLTTYENFLILGYTYENGNWYPQRMRWNSIGEETNWLTGTKGSTEVGKADFMVGFGQYQGFLIVFKERSYYKYWLVASAYIFNGKFISMTIGCRCNGSIVKDNKGRLYWYASDGTIKEMSAGTISQPIQTEIIDKIYQSSVDLIKSQFIDETEEVWWSIPFENSLNNKVITLKEGNQGERIWGQLDLSIPAFGNYYKA